jgi:iron-sulfur cluster assembly protein
VGVKKTGCSGYAYVVDYADSVGANDVVFEHGGVKVIVDPESLALIEAFKFRNPNVKGECGCGESFSV